jgi:hypothetical protein
VQNLENPLIHFIETSFFMDTSFYVLFPKHKKQEEISPASEKLETIYHKLLVDVYEATSIQTIVDLLESHRPVSNFANQFSFVSSGESGAACAPAEMRFS